MTVPTFSSDGTCPVTIVVVPVRDACGGGMVLLVNSPVVPAVIVGVTSG